MPHRNRRRRLLLNILTVLFLVSGVFLLVYGAIPNKRVEVITTKAKYLSTRVDRSHMTKKEDKPKYYAEFELDGVPIEIYMGNARHKIEVDEEGFAVLYRDERYDDWCLTEASARMQSKIMFMLAGAFLAFFGGFCYTRR